MSELPSLGEVTQLREACRTVAGPEWEDENGHVNVQHFYAFHIRGSEVEMGRIGVTEDYRTTRGCGVFSVEQHLRFFDEVRIGEEISAHLRWVERGDKVFHAVSIIVNHSTGRVANTLEMLEAHVDLGTRRARAIPDDLAARIDEELSVHSALAWQVPLNGSMGVRGRVQS
ncbi:thioesterase family protein [Janibacter sp. GS2]|uniref:thioesterase family protein n=1 Tax=Janibacter sp. GS2 TaxID=3442646 RepID=UPI003EC03EB5